MSLEEFIAHLNTLAFWREFTFAKNKFAPSAGTELELADNLVWLEDYAIVLQLKEREAPTTDPDTERVWFQNKVLGKATRQIRDTLRYLREHDSIAVVNERGHRFEVVGKNLTSITKVVVYAAGASLPPECIQTTHYVSSTAGLIHVLAASDYLGILEKLRIPGDVRRYFDYREAVVPELAGEGLVVTEADIMGAFLREESVPTPESKAALVTFLQDFEAFDLSPIVRDLREHIQASEETTDYYRIMLEFARLPRSMWREIKLRFVRSVTVVSDGDWTLPFRLTFPETGCTFMIAPLDPKLPSTGAEGEAVRIRGLKNLTYAAMYDAKMARGIGILISKDGDYFQIDWCLLDIPWKSDPEMDKRLAEYSPFRPTSEKKMNSFLFLEP